MDDITLKKTEDQSTTLYSKRYNEHYHSTFGAKNESQHIFIDAGLKQIEKQNISIFEMGLGTGLNALLSYIYAKEKNKYIKYFSVEKHPLNMDVISKLNYTSDKLDIFELMHSSNWNKETKIDSNFYLTKTEADITEYIHQNNYDLVYYDAFSPDIQGELWSTEIFKAIFDKMNKNGILMTYSVKGIVKRAIKAAGFRIEKIPGPKGKREILRAFKD